MGDTTKIEWCDHTWSPWIGCTKLSAACDHCYAADMAKRYGWAKFEAGEPRHRTSTAYWRKPLQWNRQAEAAGKPATVFASLCDPFDSEIDDAWRADYMAIIEATPWLEWLVLTKRAKLMRQWFDGRKVPDNLRPGTTAENQKMLDLRGPDIIAIKAKLLPFLSAEPLLGGLDAWHGDPDPRLGGVQAKQSLLGHWWETGEARNQPGHFGFGWVIAGGESGPQARPSHPDWFRSLRDQCLAADVPFFFKQWGEWLPWSQFTGAGIDDDAEQTRYRTMEWDGGKWTDVGHPMWCDTTDGNIDDEQCIGRVGKKAAGAELDGREWREFPT